MAPRQFRVPGIGYQWTGVRLTDFNPTSHWMVVREHLGRESQSHIVLPDAKNTTTGTVIKVGTEPARAGINAGDVVLFEEWQGGRWAFEDEDGGQARVLIMSVDNVLCVVR
jgi:co-chaperonin GroES (HSP10)